EPAREQHLAVVERLVEDLLELMSSVGMPDVEAAGDPQLIGAAANQGGGASFAEEKAKGAEQQRLARAGLAGPGAEAGLQVDPDVLDDGQVLYGQFAEHRLDPEGGKETLYRTKRNVGRVSHFHISPTPEVSFSRSCLQLEENFFLATVQMSQVAS